MKKLVGVVYIHSWRCVIITAFVFHLIVFSTVILVESKLCSTSVVFVQDYENLHNKSHLYSPCSKTG